MKLGALIREDAVGAWHAVDGEPGTLRILKAEHADNEAGRLVFLEEIRRIRTLDHPALVKVLREDQRAERPWVLTEAVDGQTLEAHIAAEGPMDEAEARAVVGTVLEALAYLAKRRQAHALPVPSRIVRVGGCWKLMTFRDVRAWDEIKNLKGKKTPEPRFAPPERDRGAAERLSADSHTAWHVGALLRFLLGGGAPRGTDGRLVPPTTALEGGLGASVQRLMEPNPDRRPAGAPAILRVLAEAGGPQRGPTTAAPAPTPRRKRRLGR